METPKPDEHHERLTAFAGQWQGDERMPPSQFVPEGLTATSRIQSQIALDGFFLLMDQQQERDGKVQYRAHGVFGWDSAQNRYTMHWFDSQGWAQPAHGTWEGDTLSFEHSHDAGHGRYRYRFQDADTYTLTMEHSDDGQEWSVILEGTFRRIS